MVKFRNFKVAFKLLMPIVLTFGVIIITLFYYVLPKIYDSIFEKKKEGLVNVVELAYTVISGLDKQVNSGLMTIEEAQKQAKSTIKSMRFEKKNYYFVFDYDKMLIQPVAPERENKPLSFFKDDHKNEYLSEGAELCKKSGEGFVFYHKAKPKSDIPIPKLSFLREYKNWGWIIGAGVYFDDIDKDYATIREDILIVFSSILLIVGVLLYFNIKKYILKPIALIKNEAEKVSIGDFSNNLCYESNDELGTLSLTFKDMKSTIISLIEETKKSSTTASAGKLDYRSDPTKYSGAYRELLVGLNQTMDAIIHPLNVAAEYIDRIAKGDIPPKITEDYRGDFNEIKNNINQCIDAVNHLIIDSKELFSNAIEGRIEVRTDVNKHQGEFRNIMKGVNATLDRLVGLIDEMPVGVQIVDKSHNIMYQNKICK